MVPYFGPTPVWIKSNRPMLITLQEGYYTARDGTHITIPARYITDLASTPRPVWSLIPPHGQLSLGALPHDWGYSHGGRLLPHKSRDWWNALFYDILTLTPDIPHWKVVAAYHAVSAFGKGGWEKGWTDWYPGELPDWASMGSV